MWRIANTSGRAGTFFLGLSGADWNGSSSRRTACSSTRQLPEQHQPAVPVALRQPRRPASEGAAYVKGGTNKYGALVYNTVDPSDRSAGPDRLTGAPTLVTAVVTMDATAGPGTQFIPHAQAPAFPSFLADITDAEITGTKIIKFASRAASSGPAAGQPAHHRRQEVRRRAVGAVVRARIAPRSGRSSTRPIRRPRAIRSRTRSTSTSIPSRSSRSSNRTRR